jgi:hypothetical protein
MLGPRDRKIIDEVIRRDVEANNLLNRTFRDEYPKGKGMMMMRNSTYNGLGMMTIGSGLQTVQNTRIQQGLPSIGAVGPRRIDISQMNMEGEGLGDFIKSLVKGVSKAVIVGKKVYDKAKPIVEKGIEVAKQVAPVVSDVIQSVKDIKDEINKKPESEEVSVNPSGSSKKKRKSLKQVMNMIEKMKGNKGGNCCGGKKIKSDVISTMEDVQEIGSGKKKLNPWIRFLQMKKLKIKDLPKKGTDNHKKMMDEYQKFKSK